MLQFWLENQGYRFDMTRDERCKPLNEIRAQFSTQPCQALRGRNCHKGDPGLRCVNGASDSCRLTLSGVASWMPLDIGAMPQKIQTRCSLQETTYVYVR